MAFTGHEDHRITLDEARALVANRRRNDPPETHRCGFFGRDILEEILAQQGCVGIRAYYARHADGADTLVLVGVTADETDMTAGTLAQNYKPCPPNCDPGSTLTT